MKGIIIKRVLTLLSALILLMMLFGCDNATVIRGVKWGMSIDEVASVESKNTDSSQASKYKGQYLVLGCVNFDADSDVIYSFKNDKLNQVSVTFNDKSIDNYKELFNYLSDKLGEPTKVDDKLASDSVIKVTWKNGNSKLLLVYGEESGEYSPQSLFIFLDPVTK